MDIPPNESGFLASLEAGYQRKKNKEVVVNTAVKECGMRFTARKRKPVCHAQLAGTGRFSEGLHHLREG
jgi:hypothetical protein